MENKTIHPEVSKVFEASNSSEQIEPKQDERGNWSNKVEFLLSCLGYAVGLGNVWRFPYLSFKNGGGAFLIPYALMLAMCGLPVFFLELSLGQYHGKGPAVLFKNLAPLFQGVGFAMVTVSFLVCTYYNIIIGWTFFYTYSSFTKELGWAKCGHSWNSKDCFSVIQDDECSATNQTFWNSTCLTIERFCSTFTNFTYLNETHCLNETDNTSIPFRHVTKRVLPSEEFYVNNVLNASSNIDEFGNLQWHLVLCLFIAWFIVGLCLIKGIKSSGKVVYFTALFPYVVLFILLIRGATLEGASDGIYFFIVPKWEKLKDATVWQDAAVQIFFSLGPAFGALLTMASYNKFNNNCYRDALVVAISNCCTSVFAGFAIFSILGFMAYTLKVPVEDVVKSGEGLAFIAYPEAVTKLPLSQLWAVLFFVMIITLGLGTQFSMCETVITAFQDQWPALTRYKTVVVITCCVVMFLLGLPLCAEGGIYLFTMMDNCAAGWSLLILGLVEFGIIAWLYGVKRFCGNINEMLGITPNWYWKICWTILSPAVIISILIFTFATYKPVSYGGYIFPEWANALGWLMSFASIGWIPVFALYQIGKFIYLKEPLRNLLKPTDEWKPAKDVQTNEIYELNSAGKGGQFNEGFTSL